jgi:hypothetical protein
MNEQLDRENSDSEMTKNRWFLFGTGLGIYILGFFLLARDHPDLAPAIIIWGILIMLGAFVC